MVRLLSGFVFLIASTAASAAGTCANKIAANVLAVDTAAHQGVGLVANHCGTAVVARLVVYAHGADGMPVAVARTTVTVGAERLSMVAMKIPRTPGALEIAGYSTEFSLAEAPAPSRDHRAALAAPVAGTPPL